VFGGLLSFNEGDTDNFYDVVSRFETSDRKLTMFHFGIDPAGNLLCVKNGEIVFYYSETEETIMEYWRKDGIMKLNVRQINGVGDITFWEDTKTGEKQIVTIKEAVDIVNA